VGRRTIAVLPEPQRPAGSGHVVLVDVQPPERPELGSVPLRLLWIRVVGLATTAPGPDDGGLRPVRHVGVHLDPVHRHDARRRGQQVSEPRSHRHLQGVGHTGFAGGVHRGAGLQLLAALRARVHERRHVLGHHGEHRLRGRHVRGHPLRQHPGRPARRRR
jgi:hypothetical protein